MGPAVGCCEPGSLHSCLHPRPTDPHMPSGGCCLTPVAPCRRIGQNEQDSPVPAALSHREMRSCLLGLHWQSGPKAGGLSRRGPEAIPRRRRGEIERCRLPLQRGFEALTVFRRPSRCCWCSRPVCCSAHSLPSEIRAGASALAEMQRQGMGGSSMWESQTGSLLVDYFETFLRERDLDQFREQVTARYTEGTLGRVLTSSPSVAGAERRFWPWGSPAASSRATLPWVGPYATMTRSCEPWRKVLCGPSGSVPTRRKIIRIWTRFGCSSAITAWTQPSTRPPG